MRPLCEGYKKLVENTVWHNFFLIIIIIIVCQ